MSTANADLSINRSHPASYLVSGIHQTAVKSNPRIEKIETIKFQKTFEQNTTGVLTFSKFRFVFLSICELEQGKGLCIFCFAHLKSFKYFTNIIRL